MDDDNDNHNNIIPEEGGFEDEDDDEDCYQPSEVTSVYSYIDNNSILFGDQSSSVAPRFGC